MAHYWLGDKELKDPARMLASALHEDHVEINGSTERTVTLLIDSYRSYHGGLEALKVLQRHLADFIGKSEEERDRHFCDELHCRCYSRYWFDYAVREVNQVVADLEKAKKRDYDLDR